KVIKKNHRKATTSENLVADMFNEITSWDQFPFASENDEEINVNINSNAYYMYHDYGSISLTIKPIHH
ncbi:3348_t:CDS:2, partial [Ambispora leptoticha]